MRAVFDRSWGMLSPEEQRVLRNLSVFRGGFQRQAAEQVAGASLSILSTLVNRTLLRRAAAGRYDLHELVRQYSAAQLDSEPQAKQTAHECHYAFYLALAETSEQELKGRNQLEWLGRLEQEHDNLRAALEWALGCDEFTCGDGELVMRLASALRWFWRMRGHFYEGRDQLKGALQCSPDSRTQARASALLGKSMLENAIGDLGAARAPAEESRSIFRELGNQEGLAEALVIEGLTLLWQGDATQGHARTREALEIYRKLGDRWGEAQALYRLGSYLADYNGDPSGRAMLEESATILEGLEEKYLYTSILTSLGIVDMILGDYASARSRFEHGLAATREIRHPWGIADALTNLGCLFRIQGDYANAQSHFEQALLVYRDHGRNIWETDVHCAIAENAIAQGDFSKAHGQLQAVPSLLGSSENRWLQVLVIYFRGLLAYYEGHHDEAAVFLEETIAGAREGHFKPDLARSLVTMSRVKLSLGDAPLATRLLCEGLGLFSEIQNKLGVAIAFEALAFIRLAQRAGLEAMRLFAASHTLRQALGAPLPPIDRTAYDSAVADCQLQLGDDIFDQLWVSAASTPYTELVDDILKTPGDE
jgi:tetratricopeptide (TPR) repeat protein